MHAFRESYLVVTDLWHTGCFGLAVNLLHYRFVVEVKPLCQ